MAQRTATMPLPHVITITKITHVNSEYPKGFHASHTYGHTNSGKRLLHGHQIQKLSDGRVRNLDWLYGNLHKVDGVVIQTADECYKMACESRMPEPDEETEY